MKTFIFALTAARGTQPEDREAPYPPRNLSLMDYSKLKGNVRWGQKMAVKCEGKVTKS